ncbi:hypothetical protein DL238_03405 [Alteriqipengyuania lutimaris]|uniref:Polysaccharide biosynthesis protein n=2 Tax=Alteriqipengyuania lutimaris TaxID=1538146 RepID=A0A395LK77_9SPHN|nr:hypothetical protein DL238_03405 [Alteriqipengyuania lutimaris]
MTSFGTKIPGLFGILFFLPKLKAEIGLTDFATMMAALSLGAGVTFVMSGFGYLGRRLVGEAFSRDDREAEANSLRAIFDCVFIVTIVSALCIVAYGVVSDSPPILYGGALFTAFAILVQQQDGIRAAYNEHYVTASILFVLQSVAYGVALLILPSSAYGILLGLLVIIGPALGTSILSLVDLLYKRPYLLTGASLNVKSIAREGLVLGLGEGLLMASLNFVVLGLDFVGATNASAWFATTLRIFMVVLVPVILILVPVSSYIRLIWGGSTSKRKRLIINGVFGISMLYSLVVGAGLLILIKVYVGQIMGIAFEGSVFELALILTMFGGVIVFKSYTAVTFVIMDSQRLSLILTGATLAALSVGTLLIPFFTPHEVMATFSGVLGLSILLVIVLDVLRFNRSTR